MAITLRATKGSALTHEELDDNFDEVQNLMDGFTVAATKTTANLPVSLPAYAYASLPAAASFSGCLVRVSDRNHSIAVSDGSAWYWVDGTPVASGFVSLRAQSGAAVANTGNTTENTVATITIPANSMGANGYIRVISTWTTTGNTNTKTVRVKFNGTIYTIVNHTLSTALMVQAITIIQNRNNTSSQIGGPAGTEGIERSINGAAITSAHNTTGALDVTLTAQCTTSGSDTITLERYTVEVVYSA